MHKDAEKFLWEHIWTPESCEELKNRCFKRPKRTSPRDVINKMVEKGMIKSPKQAWRTLEKWSGKGLYNYGCCLDLGWKEDNG